MNGTGSAAFVAEFCSSCGHTDWCEDEGWYLPAGDDTPVLLDGVWGGFTRLERQARHVARGRWCEFPGCPHDEPMPDSWRTTKLYHDQCLREHRNAKSRARRAAMGG